MKVADYYNIDNEFETDKAMVARFTEWFEQNVLPSGAKHICVAGHGAFIRVIVSNILNLP